VTTGFVGVYGATALAGYGIGSRLEYLQIPIVFGLGATLVAMVGTNVGAGQLERARRIAWTGGLFAATICGTIGALVTLAPRLWAGIFTDDPEALAIASQYFHVVGPTYGFLGLGMALFFFRAPAACVAARVRHMRILVIAAGCTLETRLRPGIDGLLQTAIALVVFADVRIGRLALFLHPAQYELESYSAAAGTIDWRTPAVGQNYLPLNKLRPNKPR
jgi:hypothetical protein